MRAIAFVELLVRGSRGAQIARKSRISEFRTHRNPPRPAPYDVVLVTLPLGIVTFVTFAPDGTWKRDDDGEVE